MAFSPTDDKNVLDRSKSSRNAGAVSAIARMRERLRDAGGTPQFHHEMMMLHASSMVKIGRLVPFMLVSIGALGMWFGPGAMMVPWTAIALALYFVLYLTARFVVSRGNDGWVKSQAGMIMIGAHFVSGLSWVVLNSLDCVQCGPHEFTMFRAVIMLTAMAVTATVCAAFARATVATFLVPVIAFALYSAEWFQKIHAFSALMLLFALPFFSLFGRHLQQNTSNLLSLKTEKEFLIGELEVAKAHSDEARRRAEESNLAKSRFLASMSHELRTPLNAILGFSEVMAREVLGPMNNPTYKDYAEDIRKSGEHLLTLINEILDLSRIEAGRYELHEQELDLKQVAEECIRMMDLKIRSKEIRLAREIDTTLLPIWADERSVRQVVFNLLSNAVKFTPRMGQITVRIGWTSGGGQYVSIIDTGPGIPEDEIDLVLSAFGQGAIAIKNAEQGAGLGLPIVQAIMEVHGGSLKLKSKLRIGTEATVTFPITRVMVADGQDAVSA